MKIYLRVLAICYMTGAVLHAFDVLAARLNFLDMPVGWKVWTVYLLIADLVAAIGLWKQKSWGIALFLLIGCTQLLAYIGFRSYFGDQSFLIGFHIITVGTFVLLSARARCRQGSLPRLADLVALSIWVLRVTSPKARNIKT